MLYFKTMKASIGCTVNHYMLFTHRFPQLCSLMCRCLHHAGLNPCGLFCSWLICYIGLNPVTHSFHMVAVL